jgi:hypothetical protein
MKTLTHRRVHLCKVINVYLICGICEKCRFLHAEFIWIIQFIIDVMAYPIKMYVRITRVNLLLELQSNLWNNRIGPSRLFQIKHPKTNPHRRFIRKLLMERHCPTKKRVMSSLVWQITDL